MRLARPFFVVCEVPSAYTQAILDCVRPDHWVDNDYRKAMVAHAGHYDSIMLRHSPDYSVATVQDMPLLPQYKDALDPILGLLRRKYTVNDYVAFIARLQPGSMVFPHVDTGAFLETVHRIHIPLQTNPQAVYTVDGNSVHMPVGQAFEIDNQRMHGVSNMGTTDRLHLIVNTFPYARQA